MKRFIRWLIDCFVEEYQNMCWQEKTGLILGILFGITLGITFFISIDTAPATSKDYEPLEQQAYNVQKNSELLFETNCNIEINDEIITVYFENNECKIEAKYNKEFNMLSYSKIDKCISWVWILCSALVLGFMLSCFAVVILTVLICIICAFIEMVRIKKLKNINNVRFIKR